EHDRFRALLHLHRHPVPRPDAACHQRIGDPAGARDEVAIGDDPPRRGLDEGPVGGRHAGGELGEEIGWHVLLSSFCFLVQSVIGTSVRDARSPFSCFLTAAAAMTSPEPAKASWFFSMSSSA